MIDEVEPCHSTLPNKSSLLNWRLFFSHSGHAVSWVQPQEHGGWEKTSRDAVKLFWTQVTSSVPSLSLSLGRAHALRAKTGLRQTSLVFVCLLGFFVWTLVDSHHKSSLRGLATKDNKPRVEINWVLFRTY